MKRASSQSTSSATPAKKISTSNGIDGFTTDSIPQHHYHLGEDNYAVVSDFRDVINVHIRKYKTDDNWRILLTKKGVNFSPFVWESLSKEIWDNRETGRSTHDIVPRVSNKSVGWNRGEMMFVTGHGPFPSYLHRFHLRTHDNCSCGEKGDLIHCATKCRFTLSWHFQTPTVSLKLQWLKSILTNNLSRTRLRLLMRFVCDENNLILEDNN
ncbi:hypothetical protein AVEN_109112-1 [Araneus ventricosus]|uniref:Uncharacterized protein n=1 Tax=Araneus ventricosus TaxID=182803 RepID=A0A4Y2PNR0_ARAVE|nr:hypothetical protein AVEN_109112-1 [Araneus ventricosus]